MAVSSNTTGERDRRRRHGRDPRPPQPDVRRAVDGVQGAAAPLPHHLPLDQGNCLLPKEALG